MTVRKTVPGTQLLLYSAAVLVVAPLCCYGCCTYSGQCVDAALLACSIFT